MRTSLFDRFMSERDPGPDALAGGLAGLIGARRAFPCAMPGILNWGLADLTGLSPTSPQDRARLARHVESVIEEFEPRLRYARATPVDNAEGFAFDLEVRLVEPADETLWLRILTPRLGGGLGAEVVVLGSHDGCADA